MARDFNQRTTRLLVASAAGRCSHPECKRLLVVPANKLDRAHNAMEFAHINAESEGGPRYDPNLSAKARNDYENLILMCPTHHDLIDGQPNVYREELIRKWKREHERWAENELDRAINRVSFDELRKVAEYVVECEEDVGEGSGIEILTDVNAKLEKNSLSARSRSLLNKGLSQWDRVEKFVDFQAAVDSRFPDRFRSGFLVRYHRAIMDGHDGDSLFLEMGTFVMDSNPNQSADVRAAQLSALAYLFVKCEIFSP